MKIEGKVVITGASGFIGGRLRERLLADGADVISVRRKGSPASKIGRSVELDYEDLPGLEKFFADEQPRYLLHVAGTTKGVHYDDFHKANVMPTENLIKAVASRHPSLERFTLLSSFSAYGPSPVGQPLDETAVPNPVEFYGKSKLAAEQALQQHGAGVKWTVLRPGGVYGPGDIDYFTLFREISSGRNLFYGNRDRWQSLIFVDDLIDAILLATLKPEAIGKGYHLSDDNPLTWGQFQGTMIEVSGRKAMTIDFPEFLVAVAAFFGELLTRIDGKPRLFNRQKAIMGAQPAWLCTAASARRDLGFVPKVHVREGIERSFKWYREKGWIK